MKSNAEKVCELGQLVDRNLAELKPPSPGPYWNACTGIPSAGVPREHTGQICDMQIEEDKPVFTSTGRWVTLEEAQAELGVDFRRGAGCQCPSCYQFTKKALSE